MGQDEIDRLLSRKVLQYPQRQGYSGRIVLLEKGAQKGDGKGPQPADGLGDIILEPVAVEVHREQFPGQPFVDEPAREPDESPVRLGERELAHPAHGLAHQVLHIRTFGKEIHDRIILGRIGPLLEEELERRIGIEGLRIQRDEGPGLREEGKNDDGNPGHGLPLRRGGLRGGYL